MSMRARVAAALTVATAAALVTAPSAAAANPITFAPRVDYPTGNHPESVLSADLNGDGRPDLVTADRYQHELSVLLGTGGGVFGSSASAYPGPEPTGLAAADFNGDGRTDLAVTTTGEVSVLLGSGDGTFAQRVGYPVTAGAEGVAAGDVSGDGKADVVISRPEGVTVLLGAGDGTLGAATDIAGGGYSRGVVLADVNNDGDTDIATAGFFTGTASVYLGAGDGTFAAPLSFPAGTNPIDIAAGDFDGDGVLDLATADHGSGTVTVLSGPAYTAPVTIPVGPSPYGVAVADLDDDGDTDLAVTVAGQDSVAVFGNGDGTFTAATTLGVNTWPTEIHAADLDTDGRVDLVTTNRHADGISVLLNRTEPTVPPAADLSVKLTASPYIGVFVGQISYTLTIRNQGPEALTSGAVTLAIPRGVRIVPGSGCSVAESVLTCSTGALATNGSVTRKFTSPINPLAVGTIKLTAQRTTSAPVDPNPANDKSTSTCSVLGVLLVVCKSPSRQRRGGPAHARTSPSRSRGPASRARRGPQASDTGLRRGAREDVRGSGRERAGRAVVKVGATWLAPIRI